MSFLDSAAESGHGLVDPIANKIANPFNQTVKKSARGQDFPGGFIITEFVDGAAQPGTEIALAGINMPMQPFIWGGEQRVARDFYPGNKEPSIHVQGSKEDDITIHGRFKDKHLKDTKQDLYGAAYEYSKACDAMRKRGNILRFGWRGEKGVWIRYGLLIKSDFKLNKLSWVDYDLTFLIISDTLPKNNNWISESKTAPDGINQTLLNAASAFTAAYSACPATMPQSIASVINGFTNSVAQNVKLVTSFVDTIIQTGQDIKAAANRALGLIKYARSSLSVYRRQIDNLKSSFTSLSSSGNAAAQGTDTYKNRSFISNAQASSKQISINLAQLQAQFERLSQTIPLARYRVKSGDSLQKIAVKFYGNADNWQEIQKHNKLSTTVLVSGTVLEIPKV